MTTLIDFPGRLVGPMRGSAAWGRVNGERLTLAEQRRHAMQTVVARALELARQSVPVWLCQPSLRTGSWAALLAQRHALQPDTQVLAVSCQLHDGVLLPCGRPPAGLHCGCFEVDGGPAISPVPASAGVGREPGPRLGGRDLPLNMKPHVPLGAGIETHLLQQAAALDDVGARMAAIDLASRQAVLVSPPTHGLRAADVSGHATEGRARSTHTHAIGRADEL